MALIKSKETVIEVETDESEFAKLSKPYECLSKSKGKGLLEFYQTQPDALLKPITFAKDTAFHIAAYQGYKKVLQELLSLLPSPHHKRNALLIQNIHGNTPFHEVAISESLEAARLVVETLLMPDAGQRANIREREDILKTKNKLGETPLYRAAALGKTEILSYLVQKVEESGEIADHFKRTDEVTILHIAVIGQHFDTALWLVNKDKDLAVKKLKTGKTCLHVLAGMPFVFNSQDTRSMNLSQKFIYHCLPNYKEEYSLLPSSERHGKKGKLASWMYLAIRKILAGLVPKLLKQIKKRKKKHALAENLMEMLVEADNSWEKSSYQPNEEITICLDKDDVEEAHAAASGTKTDNDTPLLVAAREGIIEIVGQILQKYPQAIEHTNEKGKNILQVAIKNRQLEIYKLVKKRKMVRNRLVSRIDNNGYTILHHAAEMKDIADRDTRSNDAFKLQDELIWFQRVKKLLIRQCSHYVMHRNKDNSTADSLLKQKHETQLTAARKWMKDSAQSCSAVAALIATIAFAAAFTLPGGLDDSEHRPLFENKLLFKIFVMMDVASLATSLTSLMIFLSILSSSYILDDFRSDLPWRLNAGLIFLFFSVLFAMLAFTTTVLLLVPSKRLTAIFTYVVAFLPICVFGIVHFPLFVDLSSYMEGRYKKISYKKIKKAHAN